MYNNLLLKMGQNFFDIQYVDFLKINLRYDLKIKNPFSCWENVANFITIKRKKLIEYAKIISV